MNCKAIISIFICSHLATCVLIVIRFICNTMDSLLIWKNSNATLIFSAKVALKFFLIKNYWICIDVFTLKILHFNVQAVINLSNNPVAYMLILDVIYQKIWKRDTRVINAINGSIFNAVKWSIFSYVKMFSIFVVLSFSTKPNLVTHKKIHMGLKNYTCDLCGKGFVQRGNLNAHMLTHSDNKPFTCEICQKE